MALPRSHLALLATLLGLAACDGPIRPPPGARAPAAPSASAAPAPSVVPAARGSAPAPPPAASRAHAPAPASAGGSAPAGPAAAATAAPAVALAPGGKLAAEGRFGMVASVEANATRVGVQVLERGGNAVDAAVAVGYALSVTHPNAGGLGGGGFMLVRLPSGAVHAIDYREAAPKKASAKTNEVMLKKGGHGYGSAPVPGVVAGLNLARERFGTLPLAALVAPAIALARDGHAFGQRQSQVLAWYWRRVERDPTLRAVLGRGGKPLGAGGRLVQRSLARTLEAVAQRGSAGFYAGEVAGLIDQAMRQRGGYVRAEDLAAYRALVREPLHFRYRGLDVYTMPPPSMGGVALASIMLDLELAGAGLPPPFTAHGVHLFAEAARRAYADRRAVAADPGFADGALLGPLLARLLDPAYHAARQPRIDATKVTPSSAVTPIAKPTELPAESHDTTHFSVVDAQGGAVACTTTLSAAFGAHVMIPETGVIPSNALGGFSPAGINAIAPGKRMASSMTPAIVVQQGRLAAVLGSPGGDTIPGTVAQVLRNLVDHHMTIDHAVEQGRVHHQWRPDELRLEKDRSPPPPVLAELRRMGHKIARSGSLGGANCILVDLATGTPWGHADTRQGGLALGPGAAPPAR